MRKQYENYKDSKVEWIGKVPADWKVVRNKFCISYKKGKMPNSLTEVETGNFPVYLAMDYLRGNPKQILYVDDATGVVEVEEGDILLLWDGSNAGEFMEGKKGILSSTMALLKLKKGIDKQFAKYYFKAAEHVLKDATIGMGIPHVNGEELSDLPFVLPSEDEQAAIADYLDYKTKQVDKLIAQKEQLMELLQKKRQAIINEAVTQGLNPNAPRKDSKIEWLGEIPAHWEVSKLKYLTSKIGSGVTPLGGSETYLDEGIPLLRSQNIYPDGLRLNDVAFISEEVHNSMSNSKVEPGDVLLNITGASIGRCFYYEGQLDEANVNQHVCIIRPNESITTRFLQLILSSDIGQHQINLSQNGASREGLTFAQLRNFAIAFPEVKEQEVILNETYKELDKIKEVRHLLKDQIGKLKNYRQSVISEAVTGKIDVREAVLAG